MSYSNGYNQTAVITALKDRVGFRQPLGSGTPTLTSAVTTSNSGRYFQDFHSLVTVTNIKATMEQVNASDADLITYLTNLRNAAIMRALNGVFTGMQIIDEPKVLFVRHGKNDKLRENSNLFIGYEINVADTPDAAFQMDSLRLYFDSAVTFNIYVFEDGNLTPVITQSVTTVANKITTVNLTEVILNRGKYYIGYFQSDLGAAKAYTEQVDKFTKQLLFCGIPIQSASTGATTFDRENISYPVEPSGLNIEVSSFKDYTTIIKKKAAMFDELIGLMLSYSVIEQIIYCARSNANERIFKDQLDKVGIQLDLNGAAPISDSPQVMGLKQRIERETKTVKESFYRNPKAQTINLAECL